MAAGYFQRLVNLWVLVGLPISIRFTYMACGEGISCGVERDVGDLISESVAGVT